MYFFEPVNLLNWNMFDVVKNIGHIESFYAVSTMNFGDIVLFHVGSQVKSVESGIYAVGTIVHGPYRNERQPDGYIDDKLRVDVQITRIQYSMPIISHDETKIFTNQFRGVHKIDTTFDSIIEEFIKKSPTAKIYNKLVRDHIPEIIKSTGKTCTTCILPDDEYLKMIDAKLDEELAEYHSDQNIEELADLMEVIYAAAVARGYTIEQLEQVRTAKAEKRGAFTKKILLIEVFK